MIEDFELESLQKLVIHMHSVADAEKIERKLEPVKKRARNAEKEGPSSDFNISLKDTTVIVFSASGLWDTLATLHQLKTLSAEDFKTLSKELDAFEKIERANKAAEKLVGNNNMYTPAKRQLGGYPRIQFNLSEKQPPAKLSPELETSLAEQRKLQEKSLFINK